MEEKVKRLTKIIQEANPELMEETGLLRCTRVWEAWGYGTMKDSDFEEVEAEITLEHVLVAMNRKELNYFVDMGGMFVEENTTIDGDAPEWTKYIWKRTKPLHLQDKPTINFLLDVLSAK